MTRITALDLQPFFRNSVGIDRLFDRVFEQIDNAAQNNYPPHNIIQTGENTFEVQLAVAGFTEGEINVEVGEGFVTVSGEQAPEVTADNEYFRIIHQGISKKRFSKKWPLGEYVEVVGATVENGILTVKCERHVPEAMQPKTVAITYKK